MTINEQEEKKRPKMTELFAFISIMVSLIVAGTTLLNYSGNVPSWWFHFSFIILIALTFFTPLMIFIEPISKRFKNWRIRRKRDSIAQKHFTEFRDLVDTSKRFNSHIKNIENSLRTHYNDEVNTSLASHVLQSYAESEIRNNFFWIETMLEESKKTFRDLYLLMRILEFCLDIYERHLKICEVFAHQIIVKKDRPIAKGIEAEFESFREKYNYFVKDFNDYCRRLNEELGEYTFTEEAIDYVKKW